MNKKIILIISLIVAFVSSSDVLVMAQKNDVKKEKMRLEQNRKKEQEQLKNKVPDLIKKLREKKDGTKYMYIMDLSQSGDPRAVEPLIEVMLNSKDPGERAFTAQRLSLFRDKRTIPAFKKALEDKITRPNAAMALYKLGEKKVAFPILEELAMEGNIGVLHCFTEVSKEGKIIYDTNAKQVYIKVLEGKNENSCIVAAKHLVEMGEKSIAFPVVVKILKTSQRQKNREMALQILEQIGDENSIKEISNIQNDSQIGRLAIEALYKLKRADLIERKKK